MTATIEAPRAYEISDALQGMSAQDRADYQRTRQAQEARDTAVAYKRRAKVGRDLSVATREIIPPTPVAQLDPLGEFDDFVAPGYTVDAGDDDWQTAAICRESDPDLFFPDDRAEGIAAKRICRQCTVRDKCLEYALKYDERHGVWGGKTETERRKMKPTR